MPQYRIDLVEVVRRSAVIQVPDGFTFDDENTARLAEFADGIATEVSAHRSAIEVTAVSGAAADGRLG
ncbi:hypothetical protein nbrc107696_13100 [Gordonia spumicola]|uniref:Uncharacterized protein n=1 Tax=Gordonia spumicola TaxID=589161 RepID=A0A7I9V6L1_9ACTN|nr:hypothetical protein nbrc107696_13100 [Gordonia spumicola]